MIIHVHETELLNGGSGLLIGAEHGATKGFCVGIAIYDKKT